MKRFTLILSLMVAMVTTAMAQITSLDELSNEKTYVIQSKRCWLAYYEANPTKLCTTNANGWEGNLEATNENLQFKILNEDGAYYLFSVAANKYVTKSGGFSDTKDGALNLTDQDRYEYRWLLTVGGNGLNTQIPGQYQEGIVVNGWANADDGNLFNIIDVETYKEPVYVSDLKDFKPNKAYTLTTKQRGAWTVNSELTELTTTATTGTKKYDANDKKQQFAVLTVDNENYYLFNVAAGKFVKAKYELVQGVGTPIKLNNATTEGAYRMQIQYVGDTNGYFNIGGSNQRDICGWSAIDHGNAVLFTEVADFDPTEALAMLSNVATVTYKFMYNGNVVATQQEVVNKGEAYPAFNVPNVPLGIVPAEGVPAGNVSGDIEKEITLTVNDELIPFEYIAEGEPTVWYYARMHGNPNVTSYVEDNGTGVIEWSDKNIEVSEIDSHLWGFVGDAFNGFKMVNKETGKAIASTGSGEASMAEVASATAFHAMASDNSTQGAFCLKYKDNNNYLNAQGSAVNHWGDNDNGSTFFLTEYIDEDVATIEVSALGYATLFLGEAVYVPAGVEAYVVSSAADGWAHMEQVTGILPANTGVILKNAGNYTFTLAPARISAIEANLLAGTVEAAVIEKEAEKEYYILANGENGVGLYKPTIGGDATKFNNAANKAYLVVPAEKTQGVKSYSLRFEDGTTAIEGVEVENEVKAIYDLTGRRVEAITAPGIYIVNGKKVLVK